MNESHEVKEKQLESEGKIKNYDVVELTYEPLTPNTCIEKVDKEHAYSKMMDFAIAQNDIKNIAVTGPYGSGKSSVIAAYFQSQTIASKDDLEANRNLSENIEADKKPNRKPKIKTSIKNGKYNKVNNAKNKVINISLATFGADCKNVERENKQTLVVNREEIKFSLICNLYLSLCIVKYQ